MCYSLLASQQSKKTPHSGFLPCPLGLFISFVFPTAILPNPNSKQSSTSRFVSLQSSFLSTFPYHSNTTTPSWPRRTRLFMTNSPTHSTISSPASPPWSNPSSKYSLFLSLIALFFNKICGICVIMGFDFELRGRIMS